MSFLFNSHCIFPALHFVPRTQRVKGDATFKMDPKDFAALLIDKLEKVKRDREAQEKIQQSFKRIQEVNIAESVEFPLN